jgi:ParB family chromosome partitioning protein
MKNDQLINQDSGNVEYYTPPEIMDCVHEMFQIISLDPASCETANKTVKAHEFFTKEDNALTKQWLGSTVWLNHPFSKGEKACKDNCKKKVCTDKSYSKYRGHCITTDIPSNLDWVNKLIEEFNTGHFIESLNITFVNSSESWCQKLLAAGKSCFITGRTNFLDGNGNQTSGAPKGCFITYLGNRTDDFEKVFSKIGVVK